MNASDRGQSDDCVGGRPMGKGEGGCCSGGSQQNKNEKVSANKERDAQLAHKGETGINIHIYI